MDVPRSRQLLECQQSSFSAEQNGLNHAAADGPRACGTSLRAGHRSDAIRRWRSEVGEEEVREQRSSLRAVAVRHARFARISKALHRVHSDLFSLDRREPPSHMIE
jgi:hypothetical protein